MARKKDLRGVHMWLLLFRASHAIGDEARRSVDSLGLCLSDFGVLEALLHKGPLSISALGNKVLLSSGSMTAAVDRLENRQLLERTYDVYDRRARLIRLTPKGRVLIERLFAQHEQDMERAFAPLDTQERALFAGLLRKLGLKGKN